MPPPRASPRAEPPTIPLVEARTKSDKSVPQWRTSFKRVYERDQCYPGAVHAALVSASYLFGVGPETAFELPVLNRKLGYHRGSSTPIDAPTLTRFRRWIESFGLIVQHSSSSSGALDRLKHVVRSDGSSFPLVGVDLELVKDYDTRTRIRHVGSPAQAPPPTDHALVVLEVTDEDVQFFDPTLPNVGRTLIEERIPLPTFLRHWGGNRIAPWDTVWFEPCRPEQPVTKAHAAVSLYNYEKSRRGGRP